MNTLTKISTGSYSPWSLASYSNIIYAGDQNTGTVMVIKNNVINQYISISECNKSWLTSIYFDQNGYMALTCSVQDQLVLYNNNIYTNLFEVTQPYPMLSTVDSKGRFLIITETEFDIYY